jgi:hypothetical protein
MKPTLNREKMKSLAHYICQKAEDNPDILGSVKLNKVLWYSDALQFLKTGVSITGETYLKRQHGPVPQNIVGIMGELNDSKQVMRGKSNFHGYTKTEYITIESADISAFTASEIAIVDEMFEFVCKRNTASSISEATHTPIWDMANIGEEIPLNTLFAVHKGDVDEDDVQWAKGVMIAA